MPLSQVLYADQHEALTAIWEVVDMHQAGVAVQQAAFNALLTLNSFYAMSTDLTATQ